MFRQAMGVLGFAFLCFMQGSAGANLVTNGTFAESADNKPAGWSIVASGQTVSTEKPADRPGALRVEVVKEAGKSLGEVRQTIKIKPNQKYRFSAEVKSSKPGTAMVQLKPRHARKELDRINVGWSTADWSTLTKDFDSGPADEVQVLCRYSQKADAVGGTQWFTNVSLVRLDEKGQPIEEAAPASGDAGPAAKPTKDSKPAVAAGSVVAQAGADQFVTVEGAGDRSGKDFANARAAGGLQAAIDAAGPGNTVHIGSGTYADLSLAVAAGGAGPEAVITLAGQDTGAGLPLFTSNFNKENPGKTGKILFSIKPGVGYLVLRDLNVDGHREAVNFNGGNAGITLQHVNVTHARDAFWIDGAATAGDEKSGSHDLVIRDCDVKYFTKRAVRIFNGVSNTQIINCHADTGGKEWATEPFAICFQIIGGKKGVTDHDITFTDCTAANAYNDPGPGKSYWNGDGFCTERAVHNITWIRCGSFGNTDGGWDLKNAHPKLVDCISVGNKRNYRLWLQPGDNAASLDNCLSAYSVDHGGKEHDAGFWMLAGGDATFTRCTAWGDRVAIKVEGHDKPAVTHLTLDHCVVSPKEGGTAQTLYDGTDVKNTGSSIAADKPIELTAPAPNWHGGDTAFNVKSDPSIGYQYTPKP